MITRKDDLDELNMSVNLGHLILFVVTTNITGVTLGYSSCYQN